VLSDYVRIDWWLLSTKKERARHNQMEESAESPDINKDGGSVRRIVVQDSPVTRPSNAVQGRRLQDPPNRTADIVDRVPGAKRQQEKPTRVPGIRRAYLLAGLGAGVVFLMLLVAGLAGAFKSGKNNRPVTNQTQAVVEKEPSATSEIELPPQPDDELHQIEAGAQEVIRRISRDSKPYSFSERAVRDIQARVREQSQSSYLSNSLLKLQENSGTISTKAGKEGLQPSLVILLALALTKGGQAGDSVTTATRVVTSLASLSKMFGGNEADSSLILIAAYREGVGTNRSHPLLKRMKAAVTNPLTERNIWYLHDQNVISADEYDLVVDAIAFGVIARNPRQFGLDNDPLNL
jgi:hypothetical protein